MLSKVHTATHTSTMHICESVGRVFYRRPCSVFIRSLNSCVFLLLCTLAVCSLTAAVDVNQQHPFMCIMWNIPAWHLNISWRKSVIFARTAAEQQKLLFHQRGFSAACHSVSPLFFSVCGACRKLAGFLSVSGVFYCSCLRPLDNRHIHKRLC